MSDMPDQPLTLTFLPLFPLGTVLFPGGELPLRVFEVRYLDLIDKCHKADAPFGVVNLQQGSEVQVAGAPHEQLDAIGTLAHIVALERPQAGLLLVQCKGSQRFHIERQERLKHGLWVADVTLLPDDSAVAIPDDLRHAADALRKVRTSLHERGAIGPDAGSGAGMSLDDEARTYQDCGWVSNRWCELLPLKNELKQRLMALDNPLLRLELVADILSRTGV